MTTHPFFVNAERYDSFLSVALTIKGLFPALHVHWNKNLEVFNSGSWDKTVPYNLIVRKYFSKWLSKYQQNKGPYCILQSPRHCCHHNHCLHHTSNTCWYTAPFHRHQGSCTGRIQGYRFLASRVQAHRQLVWVFDLTKAKTTQMTQVFSPQDFTAHSVGSWGTCRKGLPQKGTGSRGGSFWSGGSGVLTPEGALSPKFAQNRGFPLKIAWKLHDLDNKYWGARGARAGPPPTRLTPC